MAPAACTERFYEVILLGISVLYMAIHFNVITQILEQLFYVAIHIKGRHRSTATFERFLINPSKLHFDLLFVCKPSIKHTCTKCLLFHLMEHFKYSFVPIGIRLYSTFHKGFNFSPPQVQGDVQLCTGFLHQCFFSLPCLHSFAMQGLIHFPEHRPYLDISMATSRLGACW